VGRRAELAREKCGEGSGFQEGGSLHALSLAFEEEVDDNLQTRVRVRKPASDGIAPDVHLSKV
jgi:hypothetical protein